MEKNLIETTNMEETKEMIYIKDIMKKLKYLLAPICIICVAVIGFYKSGIFTPKQEYLIISKK